MRLALLQVLTFSITVVRLGESIGRNFTAFVRRAPLTPLSPRIMPPDASTSDLIRTYGCV